jgi:hypothetical protein
MLQHLLQAVVCTTVCMLHNKTGISSASSMPNLRCIKLGPQQCYEHYIFHICLLSSPATSHKRVSHHTHSPQVLGVVCTLGFSIIWRVFFGCNPSGVPFCMCCGSAAVAAACGSFYCNAEYLTIKVFCSCGDWRMLHEYSSMQLGRLVWLPRVCSYAQCMRPRRQLRGFCRVVSDSSTGVVGVLPGVQMRSRGLLAGECLLCATAICSHFHDAGRSGQVRAQTCTDRGLELRSEHKMLLTPVRPWPMVAASDCMQ